MSDPGQTRLTDVLRHEHDVVLLVVERQRAERL
jgi:hypothetical protein